MSGDMEQIYKDYAQTVYRYLLSVTNYAELAEEFTQETFYRAIYSIYARRKLCAGGNEASKRLRVVSKAQL